MTPNDLRVGKTYVLANGEERTVLCVLNGLVYLSAIGGPEVWGTDYFCQQIVREHRDSFWPTLVTVVVFAGLLLWVVLL